MRRRLGLEAKAVLGLLVVGAAPLAVSWVLVGQLVDRLGEVTTRVAAGKADRLHAPLVRANEAYVEAVAARRDAAQHGATAIAASPELARLCEHRVPPDEVEAALRRVVDGDEHLARLVFLEAGQPVAKAERRFDEPMRELTLERPLAGTPWCAVAATFAIRAKLLEDNQALGKVLQEHRALERIKLEIPRSYQWQFLVLLGSVAVMTTFLAIVLARRTTRRIQRMVEATRRVGEGDLRARVALGGSDELADLADAFDHMVGDLERSRAEIEYLQKIGAWQEVARRLAHEIKNPLTPIQLAIQQLQAKYDGSDPRFKKLLDDAHRIVTEEVAGLRRLVDAFSAFAKLPRVEPQPLDLAVVIEDVRRAHDVEATAPGERTTVRGDRLLLRRALANLVENARQAGAGRVAVAWRREGDQVVLVVDDDGPGVPAAVRDRIFDPYVTTKEHGTGLGLAIVKKTLLEHQGDVILDPAPSPLGGARFVVTLPLAEAGATTASSAVRSG